MSTAFALSDYVAAAAAGLDLAAAEQSLLDLPTQRTAADYPTRRAARQARDAVTAAAEPQPADLVEATRDAADDGDLGTGKAPSVSGKTLTTLTRLGEGWLVWDTTDGKSTTYPMRTHLVESSIDAAIVPLVTAEEVAVALAEAGGHAPTAAKVLMADWAGLHARGRL